MFFQRVEIFALCFRLSFHMFSGSALLCKSTLFNKNSHPLVSTGSWYFPTENRWPWKKTVLYSKENLSCQGSLGLFFPAPAEYTAPAQVTKSPQGDHCIPKKNIFRAIGRHLAQISGIGCIWWIHCHYEIMLDKFYLKIVV